MRYVNPLYLLLTHRVVDIDRCVDNEVVVLLKEVSDREISVEIFASLIRAVVAHLKDSRY